MTSFGPVEETERSDVSVTFRVDVALQPRLDERHGAVAARATGTFIASQVGVDDWRIAFSETSLTPQYPDESGAREAAITWAGARSLAAINNRNLAPGEQAAVAVGGTNLTIRCLEIRPDAVVIELRESGARQELKLPAVR